MFRSSQDQPDTRQNPLSLDDAEKAGATVISCAENPYDLRPALKGITARIEQIRASLDEDQPLFILIGEDHGMDAHRILSVMLMETMISSKGMNPQSLALGMEFPHSMLGSILDKCFKQPLSPLDRAKVSAKDPRGEHLLSAFLAACDAPVAHHTLFNFCREKNISVRAVDIPVVYGSSPKTLDPDDPMARDLIGRHAPQWVGRPVAAEEQTGIDLRNRAMAEHARIHARDAGAKIYVLQCGKGHLFGNPSCSKTLTDRFSETGAAVLSVFMSDSLYGVDKISPRALDTLAGHVIVAGMAQNKFSGQVSFIRKLSTQSGIDVPVFETASFGGMGDSSTRRPLRKMVQEQAPRWISEAGIPLPSRP